MQRKLYEVRSTIKKAAPDAAEKISYRMPGFEYNGSLVWFAAFKNHIGFYPTPSGISKFDGKVAMKENRMNVFDVAERIDDSGEYILGARETGSHACYLIYGSLQPGEGGRELKPGQGHEEIILAVRGNLSLRGHYTGILRQGQALHLRGEEAVIAENGGKEHAVYCISGGHSDHGHH